MYLYKKVEIRLFIKILLFDFLKKIYKKKYLKASFSNLTL